MRFIVRFLLCALLVGVLAAVVLGGFALELAAGAWPDVSIVMDDEVYRWPAPSAEGFGWWVAGLALALVLVVLMVPLILLLGLAVPLLLVVLMLGLLFAAAALAVALVLSPLWLLVWALWRALRPAAPQVLATRA
ncbi:hypothetical protein [Ideonella paludis]|uniref:DUF4175 domain-containing protein n=1 Tax=Ideonella paludis TaxID=1233411 RepID=A0ABS5DRQ3_9BURK|nr:hypothetical protein [Ideonella paludis]MBQ0933814.1 hypothetical protein [Ideonella paludis]